MYIKQEFNEQAIKNDDMIMLEIIAVNLIDELSLMLKIIENYKSQLKNIDEYKAKKELLASHTQVTLLKDNNEEVRFFFSIFIYQFITVKSRVCSHMI